jgi:1,4-alpha-glucan branching enzyme
MPLSRLLLVVLLAAVVRPGATTVPQKFRLYAPHAATVTVKPVGSAAPAWRAQHMTKDSAGFWDATVAGMRPGDGYVFTVDGADRIDPSCTDISPNATHSVVPRPYQWRNPRRVVPPAASIFYEMQVGSFTAQGTFASAMAKLPYLAELGITVVELMPVMHFCGPADSWGYCPVAPYAVRPELGGSHGLKAFIDAAAGLNMSVALDIVWNHASGQSALVNYDQPGLGVHCDDETGSCGSYFEQGAAEMTPWGPRPNMADPNIRRWVVGAVQVLIDDFHVGAFRWDSTACIRQVGATIGDGGCDTDNSDGWLLMQEANTMAHSAAQEGTNVIAEDTWGTPYPAITAHVNDTSVATPAGTAGGAGFDGQWGYPFYFSAAGEVRSALSAYENYPLSRRAQDTNIVRKLETKGHFPAGDEGQQR